MAAAEKLSCPSSYEKIVAKTGIDSISSVPVQCVDYKDISSLSAYSWDGNTRGKKYPVLLQHFSFWPDYDIYRHVKMKNEGGGIWSVFNFKVEVNF